MRVLDRVDLCQSPASLENGITHERLLSLEPILKTRVGLHSVLLRLKQIFSFQPPAKDVERNTAICKSITSPGRVDNKEQYVTKRPITVQFSNIIPPWKKQTRNDTGLLAVSPCQCHTEGGCLSSFLPPFFFFFLMENQKVSAESAAGADKPSTFYHFLLSSAICIRVVRKIPRPEGSGSTEKRISITHFLPEFHTLGALDLSLGGLERNSCGEATPPGIQHLHIRGAS